ncbi:MAG: 2-succinyl-5-enolpyruvyl-6-hydroxy-3-cyclohexene-1-carboxylic-acid synthase [Flavobacteriales bacterium]|nr:2-succinyl-5-enolpyruvyl-6-hydroxy-3-cyclohexene-1-carboxylic-acid synthase [Flavobacteriales bacterium]
MFHGEKNTPVLAAICQAHGIEDVVVCPGSRSAPLTLAFVRNTYFQCRTVIDERTAGYVAFGIAHQKKKPVIIVCTSGTAALNLSPAIAEAYYQQVPLLVLTADRPEAWIDQLDGQAIRQQRIYDAFVLRSWHLSGELYHPDDLWHTQRIINEAILLSNSKHGPVHINLAFREPLYQLPDVNNYSLQVIQRIPNHPVEGFSYSKFTESFQNTGKFWLIFAQDAYDASLAPMLQQGIDKLNWVVVHESLSNLPITGSIKNINEVLSLGEISHAPPDTVIYFGKQIVSKKLKQYLRSIPHLQVLQVGEPMADPLQHLHTCINALAHQVVHFLLESEIEANKGFCENWVYASRKAAKLFMQFLSNAPYSDFTAIAAIRRSLSEDTVVHWGNSTPIRYAQLMENLNLPFQVHYCNRGTSGIDGSISTSVGHALANSGRKHVCIVGDLSFQYDCNALWVNDFPENLLIIVINNSGGNIFRLIDGSSQIPELENWFETKRKHNFQNLSAHFGLSYRRCITMTELQLLCAELPYLSRCVVEVITDPLLSAQVFKEFYQYLRQNK